MASSRWRSAEVYLIMLSCTFLNEKRFSFTRFRISERILGNYRTDSPVHLFDSSSIKHVVTQFPQATVSCLPLNRGYVRMIYAKKNFGTKHTFSSNVHLLLAHNYEVTFLGTNSTDTFLFEDERAFRFPSLGFLRNSKKTFAKYMSWKIFRHCLDTPR